MKFNFTQGIQKPDEPDRELKIIEGNFYEGEYVKVSINGVVIRRKVYYSGMAGDLYIKHKNKMYFLYEFN